MGTGSYSSAVTWSVNSVAGGSASAGTITAAGMYTAPTTAPNPNTVTVTATSQQDNSKSGSVKVVVGTNAYDITAIQISPASPALFTSASQQFSATVQGNGTFSSAVTWSVSNIPRGNATLGTISASGMYTAPAAVPQGGLVSIQATSVVAPGVTGSTNVTISQIQSPVIQQISPSTANAGEQIRIMGSDFNLDQPETLATVVFTGPNGIQLPVVIGGGFSTNDTERDVTVPLSAVSGPVFISVASGQGQSYASNSVQFTRAPRIRIRAPQIDLSGGESTTFQWRLIGGDGPVTLDWTADAGTVTADGTYTAPTGISSDLFALVTACIHGGSSCDQQRLGIHPFRISPAVPAITAGQALQLGALAGNSLLSPQWTLDGPGTLSNTGLYTASSDLTGAGGAPLTATSGNLSEPALIEVTGQFPGLVNRIADYVDMSKTATPYASTYDTYPFSQSVTATRLYVDSAYGAYSYTPQQTSTPATVAPQVVDVYDISDPVHPQWIDAIEPIVSGNGRFTECSGRLYHVVAMDTSGGDLYGSGAIGVYDISQASPVPVQKMLLPAWTTIVSGQSGCVLATLAAPLGAVQAGSSVALTLYTMQSGGITTSQYSIPFTSLPGNQYWTATSILSDGKRLYVGIFDTTADYRLMAFDLTTSPPTLLGSATMPIGSFGLALLGNDLFSTVDDGLYYPHTLIYDVSGPTPVYIEDLPIGQVRSASGNLAVASTLEEGLRVVDMTNPSHPVLRANLSDATTLVYDAALAGNYAYEIAGGTGVGVWDVSERGGMLPTLESPDWTGSSMLPTSIAADAKNLYVTSLPLIADAGLVFRYDLTTTPPTLVSTLSQQPWTPMASAMSGTMLYVGATTSLQVMDTSGTGNPTTISSIPANVEALAAQGNMLLIGTGDNRLVVDNIAQPQSPVQVGTVNLPDLPYQIAIKGNLALIADASGGLLIYDVSVPATPQLLSSVKSFPQVYGVAVDGSLALLAAGRNGLVIVDLSNPAVPVVQGTAELGTYNSGYNKAFAIAESNKLAYVGAYNQDTSDPPNNGAGMIYGFDYADPANPRLVSQSGNGTPADGAGTLWASGNLLFCGCTEGNTAFDISQPRSVIGRFSVPAALSAPVSQGVNAFPVSLTTAPSDRPNSGSVSGQRHRRVPVVGKLPAAGAGSMNVAKPGESLHQR